MHVCACNQFQHVLVKYMEAKSWKVHVIIYQNLISIQMAITRICSNIDMAELAKTHQKSSVRPESQT